MFTLWFCYLHLLPISFSLFSHLFILQPPSLPSFFFPFFLLPFFFDAVNFIDILQKCRTLSPFASLLLKVWERVREMLCVMTETRQTLPNSLRVFLIISWLFLLARLLYPSYSLEVISIASRVPYQKMSMTKWSLREMLVPASKLGLLLKLLEKTWSLLYSRQSNIYFTTLLISFVFAPFLQVTCQVHQRHIRSTVNKTILVSFQFTSGMTLPTAVARPRNLGICSRQTHSCHNRFLVVYPVF